MDLLIVIASVCWRSNTKPNIHSDLDSQHVVRLVSIFNCFHVDINQCDIDSCPSDATCIEALGSFNCLCSPGFEYNNISGTCDGENC